MSYEHPDSKDKYLGVNIKCLINMEKRVLKNINDMSEIILNHKNKLFRSKYDFERRYLDKEVKKIEKKRKNYIKSAEKKISHTGCMLLHNNIDKYSERVTGDNILIMKIISNWGDWNKIYKNLSMGMMKRGFNAGVYLELFDILIHPHKIGLDEKHVQLENDILNRLSCRFINEQEKNRPYTYVFLNFLFRMHNYTDILNKIFTSIKNLEQNICSVFRQDIGYKQMNIIEGVTSVVYYAQRGLPKNISYDLRLMKNINRHFFTRRHIKNARMEIYYGMFITTVKKGKDIMEKEDTVIRDDATSIVLYPMTTLCGTFKLHKTMHYVFKNMIENVATEKEKRYMEMGLIVDLKKLSEKFKTDKRVTSSMQLTDSSLILVHHEIPKSCIIDFIMIDKLET